MNLSAAIMAGGLLSAGWTLDAGPGAWVGVEGRIGPLSLGLEGRTTFVGRRPYLHPPDSIFASVAGVVVPCLRWKILLGCGFAELGQLTFQMPGTAGKQDFPNQVLAFGPRVGIEIPLVAGFSARGFAELAIHPYRRTFEEIVTDVTAAPASARVRTESPVAAFFGVGIAWSL